MTETKKGFKTKQKRFVKEARSHSTFRSVLNRFHDISGFKLSYQIPFEAAHSLCFNYFFDNKVNVTQ